MRIIYYFKLFTYTALLLAVALFSFINSTPVLVSYFYGEFTLPLAIVLMIAFFMGFLSFSIIYCWKYLTLTRQIKYLKKQLNRQSDIISSNLMIK